MRLKVEMRIPQKSESCRDRISDLPSSKTRKILPYKLPAAAAFWCVRRIGQKKNINNRYVATIAHCYHVPTMPWKSVQLAIGVGGLAVVALWSGRKFVFGNKKTKKTPKPTAWKLLWARTLGRNSFLLCNVRIPIAVVPSLLKQDEMKLTVDQEGLVECNILIKSGTISAVSFVHDDLSSNLVPTVNCYGSIVIPCFSDAHTHLCKTQTVPRNRNFTGTMGEALAAEACDQPRWAADGH
eukprot:scaffold37611_cov183-Amphora_coffeaeformis.AAC.2